VIISERVTLPYPGFVTAWLSLDLGDVPTALLPGGPVSPAGRTLAEITERAWDDLIERGLAAGRTLAGELEHTLRRLATASARFYGFFHEGDGDTRSVLVAGSRVVASVDGGTVTLRPCWTESGARALVDLLPVVPKAPGEAVAAPPGDLARTRAPRITATVRPTGPAARMRWLLAQPRTGGGQLYAARQDRNGRRRVCDRPLSYIDIPAGRFLAAERQAGDGVTWRSLVPADSDLLIRRLDALLPV
jgi:hypothetical protein